MKIIRQKGLAKGGVQSVEIASFILKTLAAQGRPVSLNELSELTEIHPSKIHRYLASLAHSGLIEKKAHGRYDLGPYILELGTSYLSRLDPTSVATPVMESLRNLTEEGIILSVWGSAGSTVIRWFQSHHPISVSIRPGATFLTTMSASGRVFLAYLPTELTQSIVDKELAELKRIAHPQMPKSLQEIEHIKAEVRQYRMARVEGHSVQGVSALAAPVFDYRGEVTLSLALFGFSSTFDMDWNGHTAQILRNAADDISRQLGYLPDNPV